MTNQFTGEVGEKIAVDFLRQQNFKILETNFKSKFGEVDIVAVDGDTLVFVEVKTRNSRQFGLPEEAVNRQKIDHITKTIFYYRSTHKNLPEGDRVDVVAIELKDDDQIERVELLKNVTG